MQNLARSVADLFIEKAADGLHKIEVPPFIATADCIGLAGAPIGEHTVDRLHHVGLGVGHGVVVALEDHHRALQRDDQQPVAPTA